MSDVLKVQPPLSYSWTMERQSVVFLVLLLSSSVDGMCTTADENVFSICEKSRSQFKAWKGNLWVSPEDVSSLTECNCTIRAVDQHICTLILVPFTTRSKDLPVNFTISSGNQTMTDKSRDDFLTTTFNGSEEATLVFQRRDTAVLGMESRGSSAQGSENQYCFGFTTTKKSHSISIKCSASFLPDPPPTSTPTGSGSSLGVILGPTITVFILVDVVVVGVVFYIMKRRMKTTVRWQPRIEHTVSHFKETCVDTGSRGHGGNNYVGIRTKLATSTRENQPLTEEYEDVQQPHLDSHSINMDVMLPQKKTKSWFFFKKNRASVYSKSPNTQLGDEYEDVVTSKVKTVKQQLIEIPNTYQPESYENVNRLADSLRVQNIRPTNVKDGKTDGTGDRTQRKKELQTPPDVDWTPADEYEEVHVQAKGHVKKVSEGFVPKDSYETMGDLKSALKQRENLPRQMKEESDSKGNLNTKPPECYEEMYPPVKVAAKKGGENNQGRSEKLKRGTKNPSPLTGTQSQEHMSNTTYDNMSTLTSKANQTRRKVNPPRTGTQESGEQEGGRPTEDYDNVEMCPKQTHPKQSNLKQSASLMRKASGRQAETKPIAQRKRAQTEPPDPSQTYDNLDHFAEMNRKARAGSRKVNTQKR